MHLNHHSFSGILKRFAEGIGERVFGVSTFYVHEKYVSLTSHSYHCGGPAFDPKVLSVSHVAAPPFVKASFELLSPAEQIEFIGFKQMSQIQSPGK